MNPISKSDYMSVDELQRPEFGHWHEVVSGD